jgi:hypothetical protein
VNTDCRYPNGCDWPKPPGCHCKFLAQAQGCENRCDDSMWEIRERSGFLRWAGNVSLAIIIIFIACAVYNKARGDEPKRPFYCKTLERFERSCTGVKVAAASLGQKHAESLARKCGATEQELTQARECLASR